MLAGAGDVIIGREESVSTRDIAPRAAAWWIDHYKSKTSTNPMPVSPLVPFTIVV
jgi:hypothetical protein